MAASDIERLIRAHIPDAEVTTKDLAGDADHYQATVIAESFSQKVTGPAAPDRLSGTQARDGREAARLGAATRSAGALRPPDPNGCAVLPVGSFLESYSPISPFGGVKVGEARTI